MNEITPVMQGTYALFSKSDGGLHLTFKDVNEPEEQHVEIPAYAINMMNQMQTEGMSPMKMFSSMFKMKKK